MKPFLFVTDLDHTLVGNDEALVELNNILSQHRQKYGTKIVYALGRGDRQHFTATGLTHRLGKIEPQRRRGHGEMRV